MNLSKRKPTSNDQATTLCFSTSSYDYYSANFPFDFFQAWNIIRSCHRPTPVTKLKMPNGGTIALKREDRSKIFSFKWRGAFFQMWRQRSLFQTPKVVAASAGNHSQGVAYSAQKLGINSTIFMPETTPNIKVQNTRRLGGPWVDVRLYGKTYDQAAHAAKCFCDQNDLPFIHPYDSLPLIAANSTVGAEVVQQWELRNFLPEVLYVPVGGGGLVSGVAAFLKSIRHPVKVIGVEAEGQQALWSSVRKGALERYDVSSFTCDGTAVADPGVICFEFAQKYVDDLIVVSMDQVNYAMDWLWKSGRILVEPSAALGVAGALENCQGDRRSSAAILTGANLDISSLAQF